jgi:hypothetical protein
MEVEYPPQKPNVVSADDADTTEDRPPVPASGAAAAEAGRLWQSNANANAATGGPV